MLSNDLGQPNLVLVVAVFAAGIGMLLIGAANLVLGRAAWWVRAAAASGACAAAGVGAWFVTDSDGAAGFAAAVSAAGLLAAAGARRAAAGFAAAATRPAVRWGALAGTGLAVAIGVVVWHEISFDAATDRSVAELSIVSEKPPTRPAVTRPTTDRGTPVSVMEATDPRARAAMAAVEARLLDNHAVRSQLIRRQPGDDRSNCHGWVFTGGRYWVGGGEVDTILSDNGYRPVADPRPGDLAVYRADRAVSHTAVVRYVTPGLPVLVEGKWGAIGVYLHPAEASVYGTDFTYYRADRPSHVLAGLDTPTPVVAGGQ
ncbi:hypothetical protein J0H58_31520 [bacterium]|nr:hypothetical protein [bacterium]